MLACVFEFLSEYHNSQATNKKMRESFFFFKVRHWQVNTVNDPEANIHPFYELVKITTWMLNIHCNFHVLLNKCFLNNQLTTETSVEGNVMISHATVGWIIVNTFSFYLCLFLSASAFFFFTKTQTGILLIIRKILNIHFLYLCIQGYSTFFFFYVSIDLFFVEITVQILPHEILRFMNWQIWTGLWKTT